MQANGLPVPSAVRPGQRLVIPRYISAGAAAQRTASAPRSRRAGGVETHVVKPGETLIGIARRHGMSLAALARANNIKPYAKLNIGDRLTIPGGRPWLARGAPAQAPRRRSRSRAPSRPTRSPACRAERAHRRRRRPPTTESRAVKTARSRPAACRRSAGRCAAASSPASVRDRTARQNDGINLAVPEGTPIKAADDGVVAYAGNELKGYGNLVLIRHANGFVSAYANASELLVKRGDTVKRGQVIAHAGQTGNVTSPQLHFEIRKGSTPVDPTKYLSGV